MLILEIKGKVGDAELKASGAIRWVNAVNRDRRFGLWAYRIAYHPGDTAKIIDELQEYRVSKVEGLVRVMRRLGICEEKSSGIDRVISEVEACQLPAPGFHTGYCSTVVTIHGFKDFKEMDRRERIRACYQHCALKWVTSQRMTNSSLRERFGLYKNKSAAVSQIIATTVDASLMKLDEQGSVSRRFARYIPFWA